MSDKQHQSSTTHYEIRIDGKPVHYPHSFSKFALQTYSDLCEKNPDCYVDIVQVRTQIILSQCEYHDMKQHFEQSKG